jgi:hypothetical protein
MLVPNLHWIIIEDSDTKTELVRKLLNQSGLSYTHLNAATPEEWRLLPGEERKMKPRGVEQRNTALQWIRDNVSPDDKGVIFFADDDNSYALELFDEVSFSVQIFDSDERNMLYVILLIDALGGAGWGVASRSNRRSFSTKA